MFRNGKKRYTCCWKGPPPSPPLGRDLGIGPLQPFGALPPRSRPWASRTGRPCPLPGIATPRPCAGGAGGQCRPPLGWEEGGQQIRSSAHPTLPVARPQLEVTPPASEVPRPPSEIKSKPKCPMRKAQPFSTNTLFSSDYFQLSEVILNHLILTHQGVDSYYFARFTNDTEKGKQKRKMPIQAASAVQLHCPAVRPLGTEAPATGHI